MCQPRRWECDGVLRVGCSGDHEGLAEAIPEESREEYNQLVSKVFGDDHDAMQQAVMDIVKMILPK